MSQPATIALCSMAGIIVLAAVLQSWRLYRIERTQHHDMEAGPTHADDNKFDDEDVWIFGSVASRSPGNIARKERCATPDANQLEDTKALDVVLPPTTSTVSTTDKDLPPSPASARDENPEELDIDVLHPTNLPVLPSPSHVCQAQQIRFLHASLVPVPLRSRRQQGETVIPRRESDHAVEALDIAIYRISNGEFHLHPHPLRSHPGSIVLPLQEQESPQACPGGHFDFDFDIGNAQQARDLHASAGNHSGETEERLSGSCDTMRCGRNIPGDEVFECTRNGKSVSARVDSGVLPRCSMHDRRDCLG